ncbi:Late expression factor 5 [Perigonia lusca single nucleopolyhedrovirus]|uniref:Late expression factor 5 n=1 Tax=Perigonia lusca single nucleopolyhedrovirus TaxID=1675865 RepID=A0A0M3WN14_9ABAC|nr:Late expression factor 5 [Perigonia lusca single nucleopolyhedrovirus]AKN80588.1 Late expression factor 5 [Perigonia lusca single nucleopolyhedrovirus]
MSFDKRPFQPQGCPYDRRSVGAVFGEGSVTAAALHCYDLFLIFKQFRENNQCKELIEFLVTNYPNNVKNKTFNFVNTGHLFHSLYAYIPTITNVEKERKQIRLSEECIHKLFKNTINDFRLYTELFELIIQQQKSKNKSTEECPCQLLLKRREEIKLYVDKINEKFDTKPPKLKKEHIDNIMYKYSLNWKNLLLKRKITSVNIVSNRDNNQIKSIDDGVGEGKIISKKRKIKRRNILTDDLIYLKNINDNKLSNMSGMSIKMCNHTFVIMEKQMRAGDEAVSFIKYCKHCNQLSS